jgi:hypothetical protein
MEDNLDTQLACIKSDLAIDAATLETFALEIEQLSRTASCTILQIAACVDRVHKIFKYRRDEGGFTGWMEKRLGWSSSQAYRFLDIHKRFGNGESFPNWERLGTSALYMLAAPSTPNEAVKEIVERIEAGGRPYVAEVKQTITKAKRGTAKTKPTENNSNGDDKKKSAEDRKAYYAGQESNAPAEAVPAISDDLSIPAFLWREPPGAINEAERGTACNAALEIWERMTPEQRQFLGQKVLTEFFEAAEGADLYDYIPAARRAVVRFLGRLGVEGMLNAASSDFKAQLCAKQPVNPSAWLVEKDAETVAAVITEKVGAFKATAIRKNLPNQSAPKRQKQFTKHEMAPTTDVSGHTGHALRPRGKRSRQ